MAYYYDDRLININEFRSIWNADVIQVQGMNNVAMTMTYTELMDGITRVRNFCAFCVEM